MEQGISCTIHNDTCLDTCKGLTAQYEKLKANKLQNQRKNQEHAESREQIANYYTTAREYGEEYANVNASISSLKESQSDDSKQANLLRKAKITAARNKALKNQAVKEKRYSVWYTKSPPGRLQCLPLSNKTKEEITKVRDTGANIYMSQKICNKNIVKTVPSPSDRRKSIDTVVEPIIDFWSYKGDARSGTCVKSRVVKSLYDKIPDKTKFFIDETTCKARYRLR